MASRRERQERGNNKRLEKITYYRASWSVLLIARYHSGDKIRGEKLGAMNNVRNA
jgi:hypothetical protein